MVAQSEQGFLFSNQKRLWLEWNKDKKNTAYNSLFAFQIKGYVNQEKLILAASSVTKMFKEMTAYFISKGQDHLEKLYADKIIPEYEVIDYSMNYFLENIECYKEKLSEYLHKPFDLTKPPLCRFILIKLQENQFLFGFGCHHIVDDAVSIIHILRHISNQYNKKAELKSPDFCRHNLLIKTHNTKDHLYWNTKLSTCRNYDLQLPKQKNQHFKRPPSIRHIMRLPKKDSYNVMQFISNKNITLFHFLISVFSVLISNYTGLNKFVLGYSMSVRDKENFSNVGFFVNNLPFFFDFNRIDTLEQLLNEVVQQHREDENHKYLPHDQILKIARSHHKNLISLFNILFNQFTNISFPLTLQECKTTSLVLKYNHAKNDLTFFYNFDKQLELEIEYRSDLFNEQFISAFLTNFCRLLQIIVNKPNISISELSLPRKVVKQLIMQPNLKNSQLDLFRQIALHAINNPQKKAVLSDNASLTYTKLWQQICSTACFLECSLGKNKANIIAFVCSRDADMISIILGIMAAGMTFLPIDISQPKERIAKIINKATPSLIIEHKICKEGLEKLYACIDKSKVIKSGIVLETFIERNFKLPNLTLAHNAYLFFTSGSTGDPKGVLNHYLGLANRIKWMIQKFNLSEQDFFVSKTHIFFDISMWEYITPLFLGGKVYVSNNTGFREPNYLLKIIKAYPVTIMHFVPSMLRRFCRHINQPFITSLRLIIASGEALTDNLVQEFYSVFHDTTLYNLYGPTEASIEVSAWDCAKNNYPGIVPIGSAITNVALYILDKNQKPVPPWMSGELYISGLAVSKGYYRNQELTNAAFYPDPFQRQSLMMYRTGDYCRWLSDKDIAYIGRIDNQVKIQGYRIELSEIESAINSISEVRESICIVIEQQIISFVLSRDGAILTKQLLFDIINKKLPKYMRPIQYLILDKFPLTVNGKIDRKALIKKYQEYKFSEINAVYQVDSEEVANIWSNTLNISSKKIQQNSDFFVLGGDSLTALSIINQIQNQYKNIKIEIMDLLENSQFREFIQTLNDKIYSTNPDNEQCIYKNNVSLQQYNYLEKPINLVFPFQWLGALDYQLLKKSFSVLFKRHDILGSYYLKINNIWQVKYSDLRSEILHFIDLTISEDFRKRLLSDIETLRNYQTNFADDNLFNCFLYKISETKYYLIFSANHVIVDRASLQILFNELMAIYFAKLYNRSYLLPQSNQYSQYVSLEKNKLKSKSLDNDIIFWRKKLLSCNNMTLHPKLQRGCANILTYQLPITVKNTIELITREKKTTPFTLLMAAIAYAIPSICEKSTFNIGFSISKRISHALQHIVGPISENVFVHIDRKKNIDLESLLTSIQNQIKEIYEHIFYPIQVTSKKLPLNIQKTLHLFDIFVDYDPNSWFTSIKDEPIQLIYESFGHNKKMKNALTVRLSQYNGQHGLEVRFRSDLYTEDQASLFLNSIVESLQTFGSQVKIKSSQKIKKPRQIEKVE